MSPPRSLAVAVRAALRGGLLSLGLAGLVAAPAWAAKDEPSVAERLTRIERTLNGSGLLELSRQVESLQQEVRQLRGDLENQAFTIEQLKKSQREAYADADRRIGQLEQGNAAANGQAPDPALSTVDAPSEAPVAGKPSDQAMTVDIEPAAGAAPRSAAPGPDAIDASPAAADAMRPPGDHPTVVMSPNDPAPGAMSITRSGAAPGEPTQQVARAADGGDPLLAPAPEAAAAAVQASPRSETPESEAAYREAFGLLKAGQYEQSITAFNAYLKNYPNGQYADNAQFWVGEAYYVLRQFEPAITQYQKLLANYPESQKQSHALLKIAYSFDELGRKDQAVQILNQLKAKYPDSAAARLADERLARIRGAKTN